MSDRIFYSALLLSLLIHVFLGVYFSLKNNNFDIFKKQPQIEIVYDVPQPAKDDTAAGTAFREDAIVDTPKRAQDLPLFHQQKDLIANGPEVKDVSTIMGDMISGQKTMPEIKTIESPNKILVPMVTAEKISNPQYLTYNQSIRQKITQRAYRYVDDPEFQEGEVYLTFIVSRTGDLSDINIIEEKTRANGYLRESAMRSIKEANPFPPFPQDLNYPELTFNVIISFQTAD